MISNSIPMSIAEIDSYLQKYGPPPYYEMLAGKLAERVAFTNGTSAYELKYKHIAEADYPTVLRFSPKVASPFQNYVIACFQTHPLNSFLTLECRDIPLAATSW